MELKDKIVIVTGGSAGIGSASVRLFAAHGATVVIADVDEEKATAVLAEVKAKGGAGIFMNIDVSSHEAVKNLIEKVVEQYGQLDILVNNAGIGNKSPFKTAEHTLEDWDRVIAINQSGVFYGMKYGLQQMSRQGYGNIVNVASVAGLKASGKNLAYTASKFAVVGMTKSAALEYGSKNIRINCVCPGYTKSALLNTVFDMAENMEEKLLRYVPMKRYGEVEEIAEAIYWLGTDKSSFMTGHALVLDGGISL